MIVFPAAANTARSYVLDALELLDLRSRVSAEQGISLVKPTGDRCMITDHQGRTLNLRCHMPGRNQHHLCLGIIHFQFVACHPPAYQTSCSLHFSYILSELTRLENQVEISVIGVHWVVGLFLAKEEAKGSIVYAEQDGSKDRPLRHAALQLLRSRLFAADGNGLTTVLKIRGKPCECFSGDANCMQSVE